MKLSSSFLKLSTGQIPLRAEKQFSTVDVNPTASFLFDDKATDAYINSISKDPSKDALDNATVIANTVAKNKNWLLPPKSNAFTDNFFRVNTYLQAYRPDEANAFAQRVLATPPKLLAAPVQQFLMQPITKAALYLLAQWRAPQVPVSVETIAKIYLTLVDHESDFQYDAPNPVSSAEGPLQLIKQTYYSILEHVERAAPSELGVAYPTALKYLTYRASSASGDQTSGWRRFNRLQPDKDLDGAFAAFGILRDSINTAARRWLFTPKGYVPRFSGGTDSKFQRAYASLLKEKDAGFAVLVAYYHINGSGANSRPLAHTGDGRYLSDYKTFKRLENAVDLAGFIRNSVTEVKQHATYSTGDVVVDNSDLLAYNSAILMDYKFSARRNKPLGTAVVSSEFNPNRKANPSKGMMHSGHKGMDLAVPIGTPLFSPCDGIVASTYNKSAIGTWGKSIVIRSDYGTEYRLAHLDRWFGQVGDRVKRGEIVAASGKTGAKSPHLHLEVKLAKTGLIDPRQDPDGGWKLII